ncbi:hypothetical protein MUDAN_MDHGFNIF_03499 [Lactiplantibacillus mudanjiangensis]|uniref:Uncharacterized protein n=1 Tax=Lactiplantibacillus mudanjiangensis TaxID=1296538 RepID=A0A660E1Q8_9LACO|nr:hypothetical protein MUDAN_IGPPGNFN_03467 [Lactiplantibacillus mudanjiangensis]VDG29363.1 hypothetical protein MUDAN_MDHGFNIF_03499 [Lactiplantibacillus mudanjiangensis]
MVISYQEIIKREKISCLKNGIVVNAILNSWSFFVQNVFWLVLKSTALTKYVIEELIVRCWIEVNI